MCTKKYLVGLFLFNLVFISMLHLVGHSYGLKLEGEYFELELNSNYFAFFIW